MSKRSKTFLALALGLGLVAAGAFVYRERGPEDLEHVEAAQEDAHAEDEHGHAEPDKHADQGEEAGHDEHAEHEGVVRLTPDEQREAGIVFAEAGPGELDTALTLTGEVKLNEDRLAHIVPKLPGVVRDVSKSLGDTVSRGEVMAVLDSRELASAKAAYLAARERVALASATYDREKRLWERKISAEQDFLAAKQALAEARIEQRAASQELRALGLSDGYLERLPAESDASLTRFEVVAPFEGTVIEKHITLGEAVEADAGVFVLADLATVWVDFNVHQRDLPLVRKGQAVRIAAGPGLPEEEAEVVYVGPVVGTETRTGIARAVLPNEDGRWRPGQFVTGAVAVERMTVPVLVPKTAVQTVEGRPSVFVEAEEGLEPAPVTLGRSDGTRQEITGGLEPGRRYVAEGGFVLKAALEKSELGHHDH